MNNSVSNGATVYSDMHLQLRIAKIWFKAEEEILFSIGLCCEVKCQLKAVAHKSARRSEELV